ncbi:hypothetical protein LAZ40_11870 [Cereibacter sphaeroides]|uniref:hypothetical protein n=1 Tax=Cereibacter sphaeroides TaxID=1063 RepID=UPI001F1E1852|nr:hypothetical protein [Cereibacter sphaeroides]MCE6959717.1 hypothetical protein [Cereibacter sphaeroides]MCE6974422.1 hypothetical protein [Cereibacter sphaeroides]
MFNRKARKAAAAPKPQVRCFHMAGIEFPIPRELVVRTEVLTRGRRKLPQAFDEAVGQLESELVSVTGGAEVTPSLWLTVRSRIDQARVKAAMAVLLSFGVTSYPVSEEQEAAARAMSQAAA